MAGYQYSAPSSSSSSSSSTSYDYSGLEDHLKRQDALAGLRDQKFQSLYGGDVAASVVSGNRIRSLLDAVRQHAPGATERDPMQIVSPLVRVSSESSSRSGNYDGGSASETADKEMPFEPPAERPSRIDGILSNEVPPGRRRNGDGMRRGNTALA